MHAWSLIKNKSLCQKTYCIANGVRTRFRHRPQVHTLAQPRFRGMLKWALIFLVIALVAGALGFTGIAAASASIAKVLFGVFMLLCIIFAVLAVMAGERLFRQ